MKIYLINIFLSLVITITGVLLYHGQVTRKTAYVDIRKVFDGFNMKKELEQKFKQTATNRQKVIDSLTLDLQMLSRAIADQKEARKEISSELTYNFEYKRNEFIKLKNQFEEDNAVLSQKYDAQILERLTQYVIEYGKINKYDFIYGADNNGNIMYADDCYNISEEIVSYINNKYKGGE